MGGICFIFQRCFSRAGMDNRTGASSARWRVQTPPSAIFFGLVWSEELLFNMTCRLGEIMPLFRDIRIVECIHFLSRGNSQSLGLAISLWQISFLVELASVCRFNWFYAVFKCIKTETYVFLRANFCQNYAYISVLHNFGPPGRCLSSTLALFEILESSQHTLADDTSPLTSHILQIATEMLKSYFSNIS